MTTDTTSPATPRGQTLADHAEAVALQEAWAERRREAQDELDHIDQRIGDEVLADPAAGDRLTARMQQLRDRIAVAERAIAAVAPRIQEAAVAAVLAEADEWHVEAEQRRDALARHEARTGELLKQLAEHDEATYEVKRPDPNFSEAPSRVTIQISKTNQLRNHVARAELTELVLREAAAGRDPHAFLRTQPTVPYWDGDRIHGLPINAYLPASLRGPGAILTPAPLTVSM